MPRIAWAAASRSGACAARKRKKAWVAARRTMRGGPGVGGEPLRGLRRQKTEEGMDRRQAHIAGRHGVVALLLQGGEEGHDRVRGGGLHVPGGGVPAPLGRA